MDTDKTTLKKLSALVEKLREVQAQTYALAEEMQARLSGNPGIGDSYLRPLRDPGDDAVDEMLRPLPVELQPA